MHCVSLGSISLIGEPVCTGVMSVYLSVIRSKYRNILPFVLGTMTELLCPVLSTSNGANICCPCYLSSSFLYGSCGTYTMCLGST